MAAAGEIKKAAKRRQVDIAPKDLLRAHPTLQTAVKAVEASQTGRRPYRMVIGTQKRGATPSIAICTDVSMVQLFAHILLLGGSPSWIPSTRSLE